MYKNIYKYMYIIYNIHVFIYTYIKNTYKTCMYHIYIYIYKRIYQDDKYLTLESENMSRGYFVHCNNLN